MKKQYIYPQNMRASATLWLWSLKDFVVVIIGALFSAIVLATTKLMIPAVLVGTYALLSIRADGTTMLDFIKYGIKFFISTQQYYEWGLKDETLPKQNKTKVGDENGKKQEKRQMPVFCKEIAGGVVIFGEWCYDDCTIYKRNEINS